MGNNKEQPLRDKEQPLRGENIPGRYGAVTGEQEVSNSRQGLLSRVCAFFCCCGRNSKDDYGTIPGPATDTENDSSKETQSVSPPPGP